MPRKPRVIVPHMPHHVLQRGHDRKSVFLEASDYQYYLDNLGEWKQRLDIKVYSYCLMTNHIHLIVEPGDESSMVSQLMKRLAAKQTRWVNRLEGRTGSLWEGRYKISVIDRDNYLLQCCRYVELNPVKAKMVASAECYRWSSYRAKIGLERTDWLDADPVYIGLSSDKQNRHERYRKFVEAGGDGEAAVIQAAVARNQLTGASAFIDEIERRTGRRIETRGRGRPTRSGK